MASGGLGSVTGASTAIVLMSSVAVGMLVVTAVLVLSRRWGLLDCPDGMLKCHARPTVTLGGVAVFSGLLAGLVAAWIFQGRLGGPEGQLAWGAFLAAGLVVLTLGISDDVRGVGPRTKILFQLIAAAMLVGSGVVIERLWFFGLWETRLGALGVPFTLFWLVGSCNAFNFIDGLDGLATGVGTLTAFLLTGAAMATGQWGLGFFALSLGGGLLAVLCFNIRPARIFLGDSGSQLAGLLLGALAIESLGRGGGFVLPAAGLLLAVPVVDTLLAVLRRCSRHESPAHGDRQHMHHCLGRRGLREGQVALVLWGVSLVGGVLGLVCYFVAGWGVAVLSAGYVVLLVWGGARLGCVDGVQLWRWAVARRSERAAQALRDSLAEVDVLWEQLKPLFEQMQLDRAVLTLEGMGRDGRLDCETYQWVRNGQLISELLHNRWTRQFLLDEERGRVATLRLECDGAWQSDEQRILRLIEQIRENVRTVQRCTGEPSVPMAGVSQQPVGHAAAGSSGGVRAGSSAAVGSTVADTTDWQREMAQAGA